MVLLNKEQISMRLLEDCERLIITVPSIMYGNTMGWKILILMGCKLRNMRLFKTGWRDWGLSVVNRYVAVACRSNKGRDGLEFHQREKRQSCFEF